MCLLEGVWVTTNSPRFDATIGGAWLDYQSHSRLFAGCYDHAILAIWGCSNVWFHRELPVFRDRQRSMAAGIKIFKKTQIDTGRVKDVILFSIRLGTSYFKTFGHFICSVYRPTIIYLRMRCIWLSCAAVKTLHCSRLLRWLLIIIISSARIASRTNNNNVNDNDSDCHIHSIIMRTLL